VLRRIKKEIRDEVTWRYLRGAIPTEKEYSASRAEFLQSLAIRGATIWQPAPLEYRGLIVKSEDEIEALHSLLKEGPPIVHIWDKVKTLVQGKTLVGGFRVGPFIVEQSEVARVIARHLEEPVFRLRGRSRNNSVSVKDIAAVTTAEEVAEILKRMKP
jgi:hypothetical protein